MESSSNALLATASVDGMKLWEVSGGGASVKHLATVRPYVPCRCLRWNSNNQMIASAGPDGRVHLTNPKAQLLGTIERDGKEITCVSLSAQLLAVSSGTVVSVYNLPDQGLTHTFPKHTDRVTALAFNSDATHLLSGSVNGELLLHNIQHGATVATLAPAGHGVQGAVRALHYSLWKPNHAGSAHEDGSFVYWDVVGRKAVALFRQHTGPATDLAFSTVHAALVVSAGLDRRVIFYDVQQRSVVKTLQTDCALSALSFMEDGSTIAAGGASGVLLFLDLKQSERDDQSMVTSRLDQAHAGEVACVQFQCPPPTAAQKRPGSGLRAAAEPRHEGVTSSSASDAGSVSGASVHSGRSIGIESRAAAEPRLRAAEGRPYGTAHPASALPRPPAAPVSPRPPAAPVSQAQGMDLDAPPAPPHPTPLFSPIKPAPTLAAPADAAATPSLPTPTSVPSASYVARTATSYHAGLTQRTQSSSSLGGSGAGGSVSGAAVPSGPTGGAVVRPASEPEAPALAANSIASSPVVTTAASANGKLSQTQPAALSSAFTSTAFTGTASSAASTWTAAAGASAGAAVARATPAMGSSAQGVPMEVSGALPHRPVAATTHADAAPSQGVVAPAGVASADAVSSMIDNALFRMYTATHKDVQGMHVDMLKQFTLMQELFDSRLAEVVQPLVDRVTELEQEVHTLNRKLQGF